MLRKVLHAWRALNTSCWFLPAVLGVAAVALAVVTVSVDHRLGNAWLARWNAAAFAPMQSEGARTALTVVCGRGLG